MNGRLPRALSVMALLSLACPGCAPQDSGSSPGGLPEGGVGEATTSTADATPNAEPDNLEAAAGQFIGQLADGQFAEATKAFDDTMKSGMPAAKLRETWTTLVGQVGKLKDQGRSTQKKVDDYEVVTVTCTFERAPLDVVVSFDRDQHIAGLFFRPPKPAPRSQDPQTSATLETETGTIHGTFDLPDGNGPFPAVVIIAGSGPTDRDGNQPAMMNDSLKMLGAGLAAQGMAVLRYDKRCIGESAPAGAKEEDLRFQTLVDDAAAWVEKLRADKRFSKIGIIGHSEGSLIGILAAKQTKADAFVSIAGSGRTFGELVREQLTKNLSQQPDLSKRSVQILDELVAGRTVDEVPPELAAEFRPSVQPYVISMLNYDPSKEIAALEMPVMIVQGTTDIQVSVDDADRLAAANQKARLSIIKDMNHVLKTASTQLEQQAAYTDASLPLVPQLLDEVTAFLGETIAK